MPDDPHAVTRLIHTLRVQADLLRARRQRVATATERSYWRSPAARQFHADVAEACARLLRCATSLEDAADQLTGRL
ncbi:hypothetical protein [Jatrophihabitans sp.]|uniref:hypothetical protein n=1 Tax=Jatrophihabitans sp. TaxID=1932789 RepID=UPI0030C73E0F|nr:hypothetical protein [Jatrophihabitans sp.]